MPQNTTVSQNARKAVQAIDMLQALYSGIVNDPQDKTATSDLLQELRSAIDDVQKILGRIGPQEARSELQQEHDLKASSQTARYANGPSCD